MNQVILDAINDAVHPPIVSLTAFEPVRESDMTDDTPVPAVMNLGLSPFILDAWDRYQNMLGGSAVISKEFFFRLEEDVPGGVIVRTRILELWWGGQYHKAIVDILPTPYTFTKGGLSSIGRCMIQQVPNGGTPYVTFQFIPRIVPRRSRRAKKHRFFSV